MGPYLFQGTTICMELQSTPCYIPWSPGSSCVTVSGRWTSTTWKPTCHFWCGKWGIEPPLKMAFWSGKIWENDEPLDYRWLSSHLSKCIIHHGHPGIHCIFSGSSASQSCVGNESTPGGSRFPRTGWCWGFWSWRIGNWLLHKYMHIYIYRYRYIICVYIYTHCYTSNIDIKSNIDKIQYDKWW